MRFSNLHLSLLSFQIMKNRIWKTHSQSCHFCYESLFWTIWFGKLIIKYIYLFFKVYCKNSISFGIFILKVLFWKIRSIIFFMYFKSLLLNPIHRSTHMFHKFQKISKIGNAKVTFVKVKIAILRFVGVQIRIPRCRKAIPSFANLNLYSD